MKQIIVNESIVLNRVKMEIGRETKCYNAVLLADGQKVRVTYDCLTDNLVVADWFKFDQDKLPMIMELVKACFREEIEPKKKPVKDRITAEIEHWQERLYEEFGLIIYNQTPDEMRRTYDRMLRMRNSDVSFHLWKKTDEYTLADEFDYIELGYMFHPIFNVTKSFEPVYEDAKETLSIIISNSDEVQPGDCLYLCRYSDGDYNRAIWEIEVLENKEIRIDDEFDYRMIRDWHDEHYGEYNKYTV